MDVIFLKLLNMGIAAGWLILAVLLLRLLLRKAPKWIHCLLWGIVAFRLLCPFSIESAWSLIPSAETIQTNTVSEGRIYANVPTIDSRMSVITDTVNPALQEAFAYEESDSAAPLQIYTYAAGFIWRFGVLLFLAYAVISRLKIRHMVKEAVCYRDNIYLCDAVTSPFLLGIIKARIYLPSDMEGERMDYVIAHEQAHLKRKDHWWKPLGYLLLAVYWFQPLCWLAYALFCKDIEFACDEKVIRELTLHEKKEYAKALLSCSLQRRTVTVCPLAFGEISVKKRIQSVLRYKKTAFWVLTAAFVICAAAAVCFLTNPPKEFQIRVTIPAGTTARISYSDMEVSPKSGTLTIYAGEGLEDTEAVLLPTEVKEENAYDEPMYLTHGMPIKFKVEKGAWFKIGLNVQNPMDEDRDVYVSVKNVDVRIADAAERNEMFSKEAGQGSGETSDAETEQTISGKSDEESGQADREESDRESGQTDREESDRESGQADSEKSDEESARGNNEMLNKKTPQAPDAEAVSAITVINGNNGERLTYSIADSSNGFRDLLQLYERLDFSAETEENSRIGYGYSMTLYDVKGEAIHAITPYKDGFVMDNAFYKYNGNSGLDDASVALMNYIDLLFYPAMEDGMNVTAYHSKMFNEEERMNETIGMQIVLPPNSVEALAYYYKSENTIEVQYFDKILSAECTLQAVRNGTADTPEITFDSTQTENWEGRTKENRLVHVKVQRSKDGKTVFASWTYGECEFAILGTVSEKEADAASIPKTALYIIQNL